ncbi:MAG: hypothetical protein M0C28_18370 [Candidatus Moduliflexus flocculans]|nr:hypothetical protein [Candidatus Moduliflexus flocculans]
MNAVLMVRLGDRHHLLHRLQHLPGEHGPAVQARRKMVRDYLYGERTYIVTLARRQVAFSPGSCCSARCSPDLIPTPSKNRLPDSSGEPIFFMCPADRTAICIAGSGFDLAFSARIRPSMRSDLESRASPRSSPSLANPASAHGFQSDSGA